jgi:hypothetical protein
LKKNGESRVKGVAATRIDTEENKEGVGRRRLKGRSKGREYEELGGRGNRGMSIEKGGRGINWEVERGLTKKEKE